MNNIAEFDKWRVREFEGTPDKVKKVWDEMNSHKSLFTDLTVGDKKMFDILFLSQDNFWLEVVDKDNKLVGVMFLTNLQMVIDAQVHIVFFDRQLAEKVELCKQAIEWVFHHFPLRRLSANIPSIYFATIRLAKKVGFKEEGRRRDVYLIGNKWVDEDVLGILRAEVI